MDVGQLGIAHPAICKTDLMILQRIVVVGPGEQGAQIGMRDDIQNRLANRRFLIQPKGAAHGRVDQQTMFS